jgi:hypothetical protein
MSTIIKNSQPLAILWSPEDDQWVPVPVVGDACDLANHARSRPGEAPHLASLRRVQVASGTAHWLLVASTGANALVNGGRVPLGIRTLADREEIRFGSRGPYYFSTEQLAVVRPFPKMDRPVLCPRCKLPIQEGELSVCCPNHACGYWHHQAPPDRPCWTYAGTCALCPQPTPLDASFQWNPANLFEPAV